MFIGCSIKAENPPSVYTFDVISYGMYGTSKCVLFIETDCIKLSLGYVQVSLGFGGVILGMTGFVSWVTSCTEP